MRFIAALMLTGVLACSAYAQTYFAFADIPGVGEPTVQIDLNPQMLGFVTAAAGATGETSAAELLAGLQGIRVRVYEQLEDAAAVVSFVDDTSGQLERQGWQRAVFVQDGTSRVRMYMRFEDDRVAGMTVMVVDDHEAVFINVAGTIDPVVLGNLTRQMGISGVMENIGGAMLNVPNAGGAAGGQGAAGSSD